jgi:hypothetical protein
MSIKLESRYDSRYESEYKQRIQETVEYILDKNYGDTLSNIDLGRMLHYNIDNDEEFKKYKSTMSRIRDFLIEYGYVLKGVPGVGYYILKPKQIAGHCYRTYIKKTTRLLTKSDRILSCTDKTQLSDIRKEEHANVHELNTVLNNDIWNTIKASGYYKRKTYYDNLNDEEENIDKHIPHID